MTQTPIKAESPAKFTGIFSSFTLKTLACLFMLIDHTGMLLFPDIALLRIIGRLAFPIFAFFIAEGCRYTRNKLRRFLTIFLLGLICEAVYIAFDGAYYGNILLTFSLSIILIYCLQWVKASLCAGSKAKIALSLLLFVAALIGVYLFVRSFGVDFGFTGVLAPLFASLFDYKEGAAPKWLEKFDRPWMKLIAFAFGLILMVLETGIFKRRTWCLLALPLIALYNGKPGSRKFKYGFYLFYPLHLALLELVAMLVNR